MFYETAIKSQKRGCRAFFFYSGAFGIELFSTLLFFFLPRYLRDVLFASPGLIKAFLVGIQVSGLVFIPIFGFFASISQSMKDYQKKVIGTLMFSGFGAILIIFSLLFSALPMYIVMKPDGGNFGAYILATIFCFLFMVGFYGYMVTFFSISSHFSYGTVSRIALPIWNGFGQIAGIGIIYFFQDLSKSSSQTFWIFLICCVALAVSTVVSLIAAYASTSVALCPTIEVTKFFGSNSWWSIFFDSWAYSGLAGGFLINSFNGFGFFSLVYLMIFFNGWLPRDPMDSSLVVLNYSEHVNASLKVRLCQQIVQILGSGLFGLIEFVVFSCARTNSMVSTSDTTECQEKESREESLYVMKSFRVQLLTTLLGLIFLTVATLFICHFKARTELLMMVGFGMTGLGSAAIYSSREFQFILARVFDSCLILRQKDRKLKFYTHFEFRDRISNVILFSFCQQFVYVSATLFTLFSFKVSNLLLFFYSGFSGLFSIFFLLCFLPCCSETSDAKENKASKDLIVKDSQFSKNPTFQKSFGKISSLSGDNSVERTGTLNGSSRFNFLQKRSKIAF